MVSQKRPVKDKQRVLALLADNRSRLLALGVTKVGLFGSFARGEQRPESDVDLLVEFDPNQKTFDNFMQLGFLLEELFERRVELVTPESLSRHIRPYVSECLQICETSIRRSSGEPWPECAAGSCTLRIPGQPRTLFDNVGVR